jgi:hypothetical protein
MFSQSTHGHRVSERPIVSSTSRRASDTSAHQNTESPPEDAMVDDASPSAEVSIPSALEPEVGPSRAQDVDVNGM